MSDTVVAHSISAIATMSAPRIARKRTIEIHTAVDMVDMVDMVMIEAGQPAQLW